MTAIRAVRPGQLPEPPPEAFRAAGNYEWLRAWRYVIVQPAVKNTGFAAATFSSKDGQRVFPGIRRLTVITGYSRPTVIDALAVMRYLGFMHRQHRAQGTNSGRADEYQTCLPLSVDHVPVAEDGRLPCYEDLPAAAQRTALILGVAKTLPRRSGQVSQPGSQLTRPLVVNSPDHWWLAHLTPTAHSTNTSTNSSDHHSAANASALRASSRGDDDDPWASAEERYEQVMAALGDDLDLAEEATVDGMLSSGAHPRAIVNTITSRRRVA